MPDLTGEQILKAKEERVARISRMREAYPELTYISLTINTPGAGKDSPQVRALFRHALNLIAQSFSTVALEAVCEPAGPQAVIVVTDGPLKAKEITCRLEEESDYGRLLDLDVYDSQGAPVSSPLRQFGRKCFICRDQAAICRRAGRHGLQEIMTRVDSFFDSFWAALSRNLSQPATYYGAIGLEALLYEAAAFPSPGLVDPFHPGSHKDMNYFTFLRSSAALSFHLARCVQAGLGHLGPSAKLLPILRLIGLEAEKDMYRATGGVNTQKGALFSMGLTLGATGLLVRDNETLSPKKISGYLKKMTAGLVERELGVASPRTVGEKAYRDYGITGIRGEIEAGLPSVIDIALPILERSLSRGEDENLALIRTLMALMSKVDDTNILARAGSLERLREIQAKAQKLLASGHLDQPDWREAIYELDREFVHLNLSPGGSADLLALTWYLHRVTRAN
jgi:holo-ACP synthase/triphosphoribosyl-dephospho-CoA synthase